MKACRLSKSRLMDFLQCPKKLYLRIHHPGLAENIYNHINNNVTVTAQFENFIQPYSIQ